MFRVDKLMPDRSHAIVVFPSTRERDLPEV
jgi:hypothetical protein